ncbi:MAG: hypothetical protein ACXADX_15310 [Candidatus Hodarchaeales archaeon]
MRGINAYQTQGENVAPNFPDVLYSEDPGDIRYLDVIDGIRTAAGDSQIITRVALPFLKRWVRRVGFDEAQLLKAYRNVPSDVHTWKLCDISLWSSQETIIHAFSQLAETVKYTGASKALHILNPDFFMMWDEKIRHGYGCYKNGEGYFNFLLRSQVEIRKIVETYSKEHDSGPISTQIYQGRLRSELKLLDEYNFAKYTKKWI